MTHSSCSTFRTGPLPLILMALLAWLSVPVAVASSLYTAEAPLERDTAEGRNAAYADALSQVLSRVTGLAEPLAAPEIAELFPDPARYVLQFRPGENGTLWVTFDGAAIERMLRSANVTVWGDDRPLTLVWLAVDWGQGEREIIAAGDVLEDGEAELAIERDRLPHDPSPDAALPRDPAEAAALPRDPARDAALLRERVQDAALRRGLPVAFPLLDAEDLGRVSFSDVWGGVGDRLREAAAGGRAAARPACRVPAARRGRPGPGELQRRLGRVRRPAARGVAALRRRLGAGRADAGLRAGQPSLVVVFRGRAARVDRRARSGDRATGGVDGGPVRDCR